MAKYYGMIGFGKSEETSEDVYSVVITERPYYGDVSRDTRRWDKSDSIIDDFNITNIISVIADQFAYDNLDAMRYVTYLGKKWHIKSAEIAFPRINLTIGGVYNDG